MRRTILICAIILLLALPVWAQPPADAVRNVDVFKEAGRFAGWPANNGIWNWGNEILVGFSLGYYKEDPRGGHDIDRERPSTIRLARSLDGGETWTIEVPGFLAEDGREKEAVDPKGGIDFSNPDLAVRFRTDAFMYSPDRGKTWEGPFKLPTFGRPQLLARTDYFVEDKNTLTAFVAASKANGQEGQPLCIRTSDGGKTWDLVGWIGKQPPEQYGYAIMPSTVKLANGAYLSMIRRGGVFDGVKSWWIEAFLSPDQGKSWYMLNAPRIDNAGNPAAMIKLKDGRLALTYGWRLAPFGIRVMLSKDEGQTWGNEIVLRHDAASWDIGYPRTVQRADGKCVTIYYYHHPDQPERYIASTIWDPNRIEIEP